MSDVNGPVNPPAVPPAAAPSSPPAAAPPPLPGATTARKTAGLGASIAASLLALLLVDLAVETMLAASPVLLPVAAIAVVAVVPLILMWPRLGATGRVTIPLAALVAAIAWAAVRLGSGADPGVRLATLTLPRVGVMLAVAAAGAAVALLCGVRLVRRAWFVGVGFALLALYAIVPLVRGLFAGAALIQVLGGAFDAERLPWWLQGGYLATEVVLPLGLLAGVAGIIRSMVKRAPATWTLAGLVLVAGAFAVQSAELTRAGRSHLAGALTSPLLARVSTAAQPVAPPLTPGVPTASASGAASASASTSPVSPAPPSAAAASAPAPTAVNGAPRAPAAAAPAPPGAVRTGEIGQAISNKAVEVRVTGHRTVASIGRQSAGAGREFVIVESSWKNIIPKVKVNRKKAQDRTGGMGSLGFGGGTTAKDRAADEENTTIESVAFEVSPLQKHVWLVADGRDAEPIDIDGTNALDGHMPPARLHIAEFEQAVSGGLAFQAPAGTTSLALLVLDADNGHLLLPIVGTPPVPTTTVGGPGGNAFVDLAVTGATWTEAAAAGMRTLVVSLKGISRANAIVDVPFRQYAFLQTDQGCVAEPDVRATGLTRQLAPVGRFIPFVPGEGQLAFTVPADTKAATLLVRLQQGGPIDLAVLGTGKPSWPRPEATIQDGDVLRVLKLPGTALPATVPARAPSGERLALDFVVENLRAGAGIDLQTNQQFRLVTPDGRRYEPSRDSLNTPCRLTGAVPAGGARRFTLVFDVPPGQPLQLEYRGFNVKSELVKVR